VSAFTAGWLANRFGGPIHFAIIGFIVMIGSLFLSLGDVWMFIAQIFLICLGMVVIHTLASAEVNHNARSLGGVVNGPYVSCYYAGGALLCS
jgi:YNFM family putative membrane transporter